MADHQPPQEKRPSLDLYPPLPMPERPSWEDIQRMALYYPQARVAVALVARGEMTREEALVRLVYAIADAFQRMFHAEVERRQCEPFTAIVLPKEGR